MDDLYSITANQVKTLREKLNLTSDQFSEQCGVSPETIQNIEGGKTLTIKTALLICDAFDVSLDYLYGRSVDERDEITTILVNLRKYFCLYFGHNPYFNDHYSVSIDKNILDFLTEYDEAERICEEKDLPPTARSAWLEEIKKRHREALHSSNDNQKEDFQLSPYSSIKTEVRGVQTANPPTGYGYGCK